MFKPELPHLPNGAGLLQTGVDAGQPGMANAVASKAWFTFQLEILPLPIRSGMPPIVPVPEGSKPENVGVKYWPSCITAIQLVRQPPRMDSTARGA